MMFLSALQIHVAAILISLIILQYLIAVFCLLKLAYFDVEKKQYVIWNIVVLVVFFVGDIVFLIYYYKHPERHIKAATDKVEYTENIETADNAESAEDEQTPEEVTAEVEQTDEKAQADEQGGEK